MASKKSKNIKPNKTAEIQSKRRTRFLQIAFTVFCFMVVLSMVLAAISKY